MRSWSASGRFGRRSIYPRRPPAGGGDDRPPAEGIRGAAARNSGVAARRSLRPHLDLVATARTRGEGTLPAPPGRTGRDFRRDRRGGRGPPTPAARSAGARRPTPAFASVRPSVATRTRRSAGRVDGSRGPSRSPELVLLVERGVPRRGDGRTAVSCATRPRVCDVAGGRPSGLRRQAGRGRGIRLRIRILCTPAAAPVRASRQTVRPVGYATSTGGPIAHRTGPASPAGSLRSAPWSCACSVRSRSSGPTDRSPSMAGSSAPCSRTSSRTSAARSPRTSSSRRSGDPRRVAGPPRR